MPIYEFNCESCKKDFEELVSCSAMEKGEVKCPKCGSGKVRHKLSSFSFASSGGGAQASLGNSACGACTKTSCGSCGG